MKIFKHIFSITVFVSLLLMYGCTLTLEPLPEDESFDKYGAITVSESWSGTSAFNASYVHISGCTVTWKKGITVIVTGSLHVDNNGSLIIEDGVTVKFNKDAYIEVANNGSGTFAAIGTASSPVHFTKNDGVSGWGYNSTSETYSGGIWFNSAATSLCRLHNCVIEYASSGVVVQGCQIAIDSCVVRNNTYLGINFENNLSRPDTSTYRFTGNSIYGNGSYPIRIYPECAGYICTGNTLTGNAAGKDMVYLQRTNDIKGMSVLWRNLGVPYLLYESMIIDNNGSLTIQQGVTVKMNAPAYIEVANSGSGTLIANGGSGDSIRFVAFTPGAKWGFNPTSATYSGGLWFNSATTAFSSLSYVVIEDATTGLYLEADVNVTNSRISNSKFYGITATNVSYLPTGLTYSGNGSGSTHTP
ncbi:MAG: right-handed parallel beta-helix repeat-containing protein [Fibrobacteres bacterium]|nr:right-handed parallel beta-helix repeat-containing protein [Fibrobacterota bacterium]